MYVDGFIFFNELDLLEYRLTITDDLVDYFILVEASKTFTGKPKQLFYEENKARYAKWSDKIIHIIVNDLPNDGSDPWANEIFQRNCIDRGIQQLVSNGVLKDNDFVCISDIDEIVDPEAIKTVIEGKIEVDHLINFDQEFYYYNLNCQKLHKLDVAKASTLIVYKTLMGSQPHNYRKIRGGPHIEKGGWHLSYFGDANFIRNKIQCFSHQEYNKDVFTNPELINARIKSHSDLFDRPWDPIKFVKISENPYLPPNVELLNSFNPSE